MRMARRPGFVESVTLLTANKKYSDILTPIIISTCAHVICAGSFAKHGKRCESTSDAITNKALFLS